MREPVDLAQRGVELARHGLAPVGREPCLLDAQAQARERGPQLVRGVGHELLLGAQRARQPAGHRVERAGQRPLLARSLHGRAALELPPCDLAGRRLEAPEGQREPPRDEPPGGHAEREHDGGDQGEPGDRAPDRPMDGGHALRDPHGACHPPPAQHRRGGRQQILAERRRCGGSAGSARGAEPPLSRAAPRTSRPPARPPRCPRARGRTRRR